MKISTKYFIFFCALGLTVPGYSIFSEEQVYGWQLMSEQERQEHRTRMQSMNTAEERERYRLEHHKKMQARAERKGVTLPAMPRHRGSGMGDGAGGGQGGGAGGGRGR